jgi:hypothetical protein
MSSPIYQFALSREYNKTDQDNKAGSAIVQIDSSETVDIEATADSTNYQLIPHLF